MHRNHGPVYYGDYLKLDSLLGSQQPLSKVHGQECHDETLFIIVHQVYELWFKQILKELDSINAVFSAPPVADKDLALCLARLQRIEKIQTQLPGPFEVLETMTPMDFLEFRDLLIPASGFQSVQFREIEIKLGLSTVNREKIDREFFLGRLNDGDRTKLEKVEEVPVLFDLIEAWLERLPFSKTDNFDFWSSYQTAVEGMLAEDERIVKSNIATLSEREVKAQLSGIELTKASFHSLFDSKLYSETVQKGERRLSQKAMLGALFILLYRDEPILHTPFALLTSLMNIDENFTSWRYRHALLAHRMLGTKIGTGGSSGHMYLKMAAEKNRVFLDLFNLSSFLVPRSVLPELPLELQSKMRFH